MTEKGNKVTRERLRALKPNETLTVQCKDGYDLESQKNTAYGLQKLEGCKFTCRTDSLTLNVTRGE